jgi:hypothetical protein
MNFTFGAINSVLPSLSFQRLKSPLPPVITPITSFSPLSCCNSNNCMLQSGVDMAVACQPFLVIWLLLISFFSTSHAQTVTSLETLGRVVTISAYPTATTTTESYTPYAICATGGAGPFIDPPTATRLASLFCGDVYEGLNFPEASKVHLLFFLCTSMIDNEQMRPSTKQNTPPTSHLTVLRAPPTIPPSNLKAQS